MAEKIKILAVSYAFVPWLAPRSLQALRLMNYLGEHECNITLFQKRYQDLNIPFDESLLKLVGPNIKAVQVPEHNNWIIKRIKYLFKWFSKIPDEANFWAFNAFREIKRIIKNYDLLITFSTPVSDHIIGLLLNMFRKKIPWIAFFSDPYIENPYIKRNRFETIINRVIEKSIFRNAQAVIFVNEATKKITIGKYSSGWKEKAYVIPHSFDAKSYPLKVKQNKKLTMRYIGDFYSNRTPESLFSALKIVAEKMPNFVEQFKLEIFGNMNPDINQLIEIYHLHKIVKYKGYVGYIESLNLMKSADVLVVIDAPGKENLFLTSKIIDYIGANVAILAITPLIGPTFELMKDIGWKPFTHQDITGISDQIIKYLDMKRNRQLRGTIKKLVYDRYRIESIGKQYLDLIKQLTFNKQSICGK